MPDCATKKIKKNLKRCGERTLAKGVDEIFLIGMKDEQAIAFTIDPDTSTLITNIAFGVVGQKFFAYQGKNYSNDPSAGFNRTDFDLTIPQKFVFKIFSNSAATKAEIEALFARKDLVLIYKRVSGDYEAMGTEAGALVTDFVYQPNADDKGAFTITLTADAETGLPKTVIHKTTGTDDTVSFLAGLTAADA